jgi:tRNA 2-thiouridine synthesizing protein E
MPPDLDKEGFLRDVTEWDIAVADTLAAGEKITLTSEHWEIIRLVRDYYDSYRLFPANRVLVKRIRETYGSDKGTSIYLMSLFTARPARVIAKIAGLPKPPDCD